VDFLSPITRPRSMARAEEIFLISAPELGARA
jgi:hypothetical protein